MVGKICSKCNVGWMIRSHEQYCGYCGCQVYDFSVKWEKEPLLYTGDGSDTCELTILIENSGACPITFQPIQTKQKKAIQFPEKYNNPFQVKAGQSHPITVQVKPSNLALHPETIIVRAQEALPSLKGERSLHLQALQHPDFKLVGSTDVRYRKGTEKVALGLRIEVLKDRFYIDDVKFSHGCIHRICFSKECHEKDRAMKSIHLEIDCSKLNDGVNSEKLRFKLRGFSKPIEQTIRVQAEVEPEPPRLFVPKMDMEITQEREKIYTLTLQNTGERPLTIQNIAFNDPFNFIQLQNVAYPINIKADEHQNVEMLISSDGVKPDTYPINFTINSNCESAPQYQDVLNVRVNKRENYPHYLAIDFGTTNSCCAYIDLDTHKPKLIPLDNEAKPPEIMPSSIIYHSNPIDGKTHRVGYDADTHRTSEIDGSYYITSAKRWLGYQWARHFPNNLKLQPSDVVADIFKHIIEQAEKYLDAFTTKSKIRKCIVTYPTMFPHRQREDLRRAFEKNGITDVILIDEGSAASIATIFQRRGKVTSRDYRLLVYDFGGGTIDIVLSQVINDEGEIKFEPLASGGDPTYGGEDVTQAIVDTVLNKFKSQIRNVNPDLSFEIPYFDRRETPQPTGNSNIVRVTRSNTSILYATAEEMKRKLSKETETVGYFSLMVLVGTNIRPLAALTENDISVQLSTQQLQEVLKHGLSKTFNDIDTMIEDNGGRLPDTVILAGQSSKMLSVKEMMTAHFQKKYGKSIDVRLGKPPKECVVLGAAEYGSHYTLPDTGGDWIEYSDLANITHSRLGIVQVRERQPIFREIIPKGKRIPNDSINTIDFRLRSHETYIAVHEHFGTDDNLSNASQIASYTLLLPENVSKAELQKARLEMSVKADGKIELIAFVGDTEYKSTVEQIAPPVVNKIGES